ncbi:MAG: hypothetical protein IPG54_13530 [Sphingomonadales bacterium]|nr:hypothetical protein [Sphingomonadales bacterium]
MPVDDRLHILTQQIVRARISYDLWWFTFGQPTRSQILDTLNDHPDFFRFSEHSHFVSMIIHCAVVWDKDSRSISLPSVAKDVLDTARYQNHCVLQKRIDISNCQAKDILSIRHNAIAHRSAIEDYAQVFQDAGVKPDELKVAMARWLSLTNELRAIRGLRQEDFREGAVQDFRGIIHRLGGPDLRPKSWLDEILTP